MDVHDQLDHDLTNHAPNAAAVVEIETIRRFAKAFGHEILARCPLSRERSLAVTNLEQSTMWAVAAIARDDLPGGISPGR